MIIFCHIVVQVRKRIERVTECVHKNLLIGVDYPPSFIIKSIPIEFAFFIVLLKLTITSK